MTFHFSPPGPRMAGVMYLVRISVSVRDFLFISRGAKRRRLNGLDDMALHGHEKRISVDAPNDGGAGRIT